MKKKGLKYSCTNNIIKFPQNMYKSKRSSVKQQYSWKKKQNNDTLRNKIHDFTKVSHLVIKPEVY